MVFFRCSRAICVATASHATVSATFNQANPHTPSPIAVPPNTTPACSTSPMRVQNVSITDFALYLASRDVGRNNACRIVFWIE